MSEVHENLRLRDRNKPIVLLALGALVGFVGAALWIGFDTFYMTPAKAARAASGAQIASMDSNAFTPYGALAGLERSATPPPLSIEGNVTEAVAGEIADRASDMRQQILASANPGPGQAQAAPLPPAATPVAEASKGEVVINKVVVEGNNVSGNKVTLAPEPQAPAGPVISTEEQQEMMVRVAALIKQGNIAGARVVLSRLSDAGNSRATFALAQTYDPVMLNQWKVLGIKPDADKAIELYQRAVNEGIGAAQERLAALVTPKR